MIDLHLHTNASDGRSSPAELVRLAANAGITTLSVTDHDTVAAVGETSELGRAAGIGVVPGIEITAVWHERDIHVLGYFLDPSSLVLAEFLADQRRDRVRRVRAMAARLAELGKPIDAEPAIIAAEGHPGRAVGRPEVARALVRAGHASDIADAFERWIGSGCVAYEPRRGARPEEVVRLIGDAGGIASLAHPGVIDWDDEIPALARSGLAALEAYHSDHTPEMTARYLALARELGLGVSGGSDYHGEAGHRQACLGIIGLPAEEFERLAEQAKRRASHSL